MKYITLKLPLTVVAAIVLVCRLTEGCTGRKVLNGEKGIISDGPKEYPRFARCEWLIEAGGPNKTIHLEFKSMATECSFDFLFVYDGRSYSSKMIASLSGDSHPETITATSGYMLLYLFSDRNYVKAGFEAHYSVLDCPKNCSHHGQCINNTCHCIGYYGQACDKLFCPDQCSGHGTCTLSSNGKKCVCDPGYVGLDCGLSTDTEINSHYWYRVADEDTISGRTAHTGLFSESTNCLYIFGGFNLNNVLNDLNKFCFEDNNWSQIAASDLWPSPRKGHAAAEGDNEGFYIFGGTSFNDMPNAELWFFNTSSDTWLLMATNSSVQPPAVTGHTLTNVDNKWLYLFGGKSHEISTLDTIYRIQIPGATQWEQVKIRGGNFPPRRLVGHSTVFHQESRSLIVFGGYSQENGLVSERTRQMHMFNIDDGFWSVIHNKNWEEPSLPFPRAFHSAVIMGNYMVVYGGNTHKHHQLEVCYNSDLYLYHLGCHVWYNDTTGFLRPNKGRFGHVAAVANGNQLIIMGGYNGRVLSDLLVYKVSPAIARHKTVVSEDLDHCLDYSTNLRCLNDPDCVYCSNIQNKPKADNNNNNNNNEDKEEMPGCIHRTRTDMCINGDIQDLQSKRCPGICSVLSTCSACVSQGRGANLTTSLPRRRVYNEACSWCVKQAVCTPRAVPQGTCLAADNTVSGIQGWWGGLSANLTTHQQCQTEDFPAGLQWIEYRFPMNSTYPDHLSIVRRTEQTLQFKYRFMREIEEEFTYYGALRGFIHPLNAPPPPGETYLQLHLKMIHGQSLLYLSKTDNPDNMEMVLSLASYATYNESVARRLDRTPMFPNIARGNRYFIEIILKHIVKKERGKDLDEYPESNIKLEWNGALKSLTQQPLSSEFLQPFTSETCSGHYNCLACLSNNACGWCNALRTCMNRSDAMGTSVCANLSSIQYLITTPSQCPMCDDYVECGSCTKDNLCEWMLKDGHCTRRYRYDEAVRTPENCRVPCQYRATCDDCVSQTDECAWCENTRTCLPFSEYVPRYLYGQCTKWIDMVQISQDVCRQCNLSTTCNQCLEMYGCGWCFNTDNPTIGHCIDGDFNGLVDDSTCSAVLTDIYNISESVSANTSWAYESCPDIDECRLDLHDCHDNATCINTDDKYICKCKPGFKGDGTKVCDKSCLYECIHGNCSGEPDHVCNCILGWTGPDCSNDCGCNNHSTCHTGVGVCDDCHHGTTGLHCEHCQVGSYGNPFEPKGCTLCGCNGHGDIKYGICNNITAECYCTHNTKGLHCQQCNEGYYGDPRHGMKCYLRCDDRTILTNITQGALGTHQGSGVVHRSHAYCLWLMTVFSDISNINPPPDIPVPSIRLAVEGDMEVKCGRHLLYIYDGTPEFISGVNNSATLLGAFCGMKPGRDFVVVAKSGVITVYFEADIRRSSSRGFNASFQINMCPDECRGHRECVDGECVCQRGFGGINCEVELCPRNCSYNLTQGECNHEYGMCECTDNFVGAACNIPVDTNLPRLELLIDPNRMKNQTNLPPALMGHSLTSCGDGNLYLFGGISPSEGLQSDMWVYEISVRKWMKVIPIDAKPSGRYYHGAACVPLLKIIFVFGGFLASSSGESYVPTNQLWKYNIESQVWSNITQAPNWVPPLAGHTFTHMEDTKIVIIGGFSADNYFSNKVFLYDAKDDIYAWKEYEQNKLEGAFPIGLYGHTAVYDEATSTIFTFGGYLYRFDHWVISHVVYTFDVRSNEWNLLTLKNSTEWRSRVFHTSILYNNTLITVGGQTEDGSYASDILIYNTHCNTIQTLRLADLETVYGLTTVAGLQGVREGGENFIMGGFSGMAHGSLTKLIMPSDTCRVFRNQQCEDLPSCTLCNTNTTQICYQNTNRRPPECTIQSTSRRRGCREEEYHKKHCKRYPTCSQCLARYPGDPSYESMCKWCTNCKTGLCIAKDADCATENKCQILQHSVVKARSCPEYICPAADCKKCLDLGPCMWTRNFKKTGEIAHTFASTPKHNWTCIASTLKTKVSGSQPEVCPKPCNKHKNCSACLGSNGAEGGSQKCIWSQTLHECMSPAYLPLHCSFGECGFVIQEKGEEHCPRLCSEGKKCADCVTMPGCGWCALEGQNGLGACLPGGLHKPTSGQCSVENISIDMSDIPGIGANTVSWSFGQCPPENECINQHDSCDRETQNCIDTTTFYVCQCKEGYIHTGKSCEPVCHQGCDHGTCVRPDRCQCHFGWVGDNCSVECQCNKHSNCRSTTEPSVCLDCQNNTQGAQCQECKEHFVGNPRDGGECIPCLMFCYNHSSKCLTHKEFIASQISMGDLSQMSHTKYYEKRPGRGPMESDAKCVKCKHNTTGTKCEKCLDGYFRLQDRPKTEGCIKCQCNGHSNMCNEHTGENCQCHNNTESKCDSKDDSIPCWRLQCSHCKEYFIGTPTEGHQCYRQLTIDREYCFDPETQKNCNQYPQPLHQGRTVFFEVPPKYLNVDIRVTIDVTMGGVDVYFANSEEIFKTEVNATNGIHLVHLDNKLIVDKSDALFGQSDLLRRNKRSVSEDSNHGKRAAVNSPVTGPFYLQEVQANDLNTFITIKKHMTILVVRDVQFRLVITLPSDVHKLGTSRFFIVLSSKGDKKHNVTYGSLYFRQDQPHIDLFVFFSVFFSCFFLFLAMCVMLWKMKQAFDTRRNRQLRAQEMECMASRPFSKVLVLIKHDYCIPTPISFSLRKNRPIKLVPKNMHCPNPSPIHLPPINIKEPQLCTAPIAVEPTDDGIAAVGTILIQLPGDIHAPTKLCLGSALTMRLSQPVQATKGSRARPSATTC